MNPKTPRAGVLSEEEVERFHRDGLLVIENPCPADLIDAVLQDMEPILRDPTHPWKDRYDGDVLFTKDRPADVAGYYWDRIRNAWVFSKPVRNLALNQKILSAVETLYGAKVLPYQTLNFPVGTEQSVHFDAMAFQSEPPGYMCGLWIALEDMDMDNGPLIYYPGSHNLASTSADRVQELLGKRLPQREEFSSHKEYSTSSWREHAKYCQRLIERHGLEPRYATIKKGQAVVWAANTLHGGSPVKDYNRTRHSQVTHYFFEGGSRVYTPTRTEGDHVFWDYPCWIRDPLPEYSTDLLHQTIRMHANPGSKVLIAIGQGEDDLLQLEGFDLERFPGVDADWRLDPSGAERVKELEGLRAAGATHIVFPRTVLWSLENQWRDLQEHLEGNYPGLVRDGYVCAIYALDQAEQA